MHSCVTVCLEFESFLFSPDESIEIDRSDGCWLNVGFGVDSKTPKTWCLPERGFVEILLTGNND